ncbi:YmdB family metallophosphoesterase [Rhodopirellula sp. MGV]|uniref:TIGR00282 family metallophosphoesterase n=1 Tax=Rhodopirellula sp. MGV TaxID=2023130 RepID=UPI000B9739A4|nr:TIGR00282 family metallophosphoesterase [Rhodopirellula sp. MGV]OYP29448.1 metallophosphoesterase [Rhodopirellula sp. MGV]PNY35754.1 metallophosphoesterase [Rhodopirellula baltica]
MKFLFLGDIVGKPGMNAVLQNVQRIREELSLDYVVANAENASDGSGLMPKQFDLLIDNGIDGVTLGDHIYRRKEIISTLQKSDRIVRPANYPKTAAGRRWALIKRSGRSPLGIVSLMGRVFMKPVDCPFEAVDEVLDEVGEHTDHILVDVHAEATSDKQCLARYLDGRVTAVLGTHTHVPTADSCILPGETAFQCDVGMCGPYESIIGRDIERVIHTTRTAEPCHFHVATGDVRLCGAIVEAGDDGRALSIERFQQRVVVH